MGAGEGGRREEGEGAADVLGYGVVAVDVVGEEAGAADAHVGYVLGVL